MYTIGEFSRITSTTVKALHHYHEKGVLVPSYIEQSTNYRYYNSDDVEKIRIINALKLVGFSLREIVTLLDEVSDDSALIDILQLKKDVITAKINSLNQASSTIDSILTKEKEAVKMVDKSSEIQIKSVENMTVVSTKWQGKYSDTGQVMGKVYRSAGRHAAGPAMNLYYDGEYRDIANIETCLPVKKTVKSACECKVLSGATVATIVHIGPYDTLPKSYEKLFEYIHTQGKTSLLPIRELYLKGPGMIFKGNANKYITEIQVPITSDNHI